MSADVSMSTSVPATRDEAQVERRAPRRRSRRRIGVLALRFAIFVVLIGGWELCARAGIIDPFFFGQPTQIVKQLSDWVQNGTQAGPLLDQILVTLEEALLGFVIGVVLGVVC